MILKLPNKLTAINMVSLLVVVVTTIYPIGALRVVLGIPFLLFFPGYTLIMALLPARGPGRAVETAALSLALSIGVVPFIGLLLNLTPWGIQLEPVLFFVAALISLFSILAMLRFRRRDQTDVSAHERPQLPVYRVPAWHDRVLTGIMIVVGLVALTSLMYFAGAPKRGEEFTAFYIASGEDSVTGGIQQPGQGQTGRVTVGIRNHEGREVSYRIEVVVDGQKSGEIGPVVLVHEQEWLGQANLPAISAPNQKVELLLYKNGETVPYLEPLYFWVNAGA